MLAAVFLLAAALFVGARDAQACTAVYVGKDVSDDGTVIMAKSNDYGDNFANHLVVEPAVKNKPGRNPETLEILDELKPIDPIEVKLDGSFYKDVPQVPSGGIPVVAIVLIFVGLDVAATAWFFSRRLKKN